MGTYEFIIMLAALGATFALIALGVWIVEKVLGDE